MSRRLLINRGMELSDRSALFIGTIHYCTIIMYSLSGCRIIVYEKTVHGAIFQRINKTTDFIHSFSKFDYGNSVNHCLHFDYGNSENPIIRVGIKYYRTVRVRVDTLQYALVPAVQKKEPRSYQLSSVHHPF